MVFLSPSRMIPEQFSKVDNDRFLSCASRLLIHNNPSTQQYNNLCSLQLALCNIKERRDMCKLVWNTTHMLWMYFVESENKYVDL
jgi:hypothetical protein